MQNIPSDNLAFPILIKLKTGSSGSGFFLNTGNAIYLVSAKHVLYDKKRNKLKAPEAKLTCPGKDIKDEAVSEYLINFQELHSSGNIFLSPDADVCAIKLSDISSYPENKVYQVKFVKGVKIIKQAKSGIVNINASSSKLLNEVLISNDVYVYGYPSSLGMRKSPQFDYSQPLLRKGIVANINKKLNTIILDCPVYYGNSGGPVIEVEYKNGRSHHSLIGVVSQFIPFVENWKNVQSGIVNTEISNSGYSVAVSMDSIFDMLGFKKDPT